MLKEFFAKSYKKMFAYFLNCSVSELLNVQKKIAAIMGTTLNASY